MRKVTPEQVQLTESLGPVALREAFGISRETLSRLEIYAELLITWQRTMNLVAPKTIAELWRRHMADSAQLVGLVPAPAHWVDFGSGAGFPGLVVAILLAGSAEAADAPSRRVTLVESDAKKCAFLREVVRRTGLAPLIAVEILTQRIESAATRAKIGIPDVVSARAVAQLADLLMLSAPLFGADTIGLFPKGRGAEAELGAAAADWQFTSRLHPSCTDREGMIVEIRAPSRKTEGVKA